MPVTGSCFVIMPFRPELHYMYLYVKDHLERNHNLSCERGDSRYDETGILEKIKKYIQSADVIIADCSQRNPNVFYELGMAHILEKPVILITSDEISQMPTDVRCREFIRYDLADHAGFLSKLDLALSNVMGSYEALYETARRLFLKLRADKHLNLEEASKADFVRAAAARARTNTLPDPTNDRDVAKTMMSAMSRGYWDLDTIDAFRSWFEQNYPS